MNTRLIWKLKKAHAIEIGAFQAYKGHAKYTQDEAIKSKILEIQHDEFRHRMEVGSMLYDLGEKSDIFLDLILWCIGQSISFACRFMGARAAAWGAKIMEIMGSSIYLDLAKESEGCVSIEYKRKFEEMARNEQEHEEFFDSLFKPQCTCRYLIYLNGQKAREANPFCRAEHRY
jgi:demethoxyubiquinone hydroxylase (CLK1/Coq7/Cat5 family)